MDTALIALEQADICQETRCVLEQVRVEIHRSEFVYLIGKVGSGKTSLIKTLYADLPLQRGRARISGFDLATIQRHEVPLLRRKLGIIFQDFQLLSDRDVFQNLDFVLRATGWKRNRAKRIDEVLEKVGMSDKRHAMPHRLSGGEFQRVAIARALLNNPDIILADEPTGHLDPKTTDDIVSLLYNLVEAGRTVLLATHDHSLMQRYPGRVLECADGHLSERTAAPSA